MAIQLGWKEKVSGTLAQALAKEARQAPNCFQLNGTGGVIEGIEMTLDHPRLPSKPAVFVGEWRVVRNFRDGCLYLSNGDGTATVKRASVEWVRVGEGKPFPTLVKPEGKTSEALVHVSVPMPSNFSAKEKFWTGVLAGQNAKVLAFCLKEKEFLVQFLEDGASATTFYEDGSVKGLLWEDFQLKVIDFSLEDQAKARVLQIEKLMEEAEAMDGNAKVKKQDFAFHLLCGVLAVGGSRSKEVFDLAFERILDAVDDGLVRPGVKAHVERAVCQAMAADPEKMENNLLILRGSAERSGGEQEAAGSAGRKTGRAAKDGRQRKAERSVADRALRDSMRGKSGGSSAKKAGSGKKGKNKNKKK